MASSIHTELINVKNKISHITLSTLCNESIKRYEKDVFGKYFESKNGKALNELVLRNLM